MAGSGGPFASAIHLTRYPSERLSLQGFTVFVDEPERLENHICSLQNHKMCRTKVYTAEISSCPLGDQKKRYKLAADLSPHDLFGQ